MLIYVNYYYCGKLFVGLYSMTLSSFGSQSMTSAYDPTDQEHVYNMSHPHRGHLVLINNRHFSKETHKEERRGSDVDAANLFATFKQLGFDVNLQSNLTCQQMLRMAIDCKSSSSCVSFLCNS